MSKYQDAVGDVVPDHKGQAKNGAIARGRPKRIAKLQNVKATEPSSASTAPSDLYIAIGNGELRVPSNWADHSVAVIAISAVVVAALFVIAVIAVMGGAIIIIFKICIFAFIVVLIIALSAMGYPPSSNLIKTIIAKLLG